MKSALIWFLLGFWTHWTIATIYAVYKVYGDPETFANAIKAVSDGGR